MLMKRLACAWCWEPEIGRKQCYSCGMKANGKFLKEKWQIPSELNRYHRGGIWWEEPDVFPASFSSPSGYIVFESKEELASSPYVRVAKNSTKVWLKKTKQIERLSNIPGFIKISKPKIIHEDIPDLGPDGSVYLIVNEVWPGWIKVGESSDPDRRLKNYQTGDPFRNYTLVDSFWFKDRKLAEKGIHSILKTEGYESEGEWFKIKESIVKKLILDYQS